MTHEEILTAIALVLMLMCIYYGHKLYKTMERNIEHQYKRGYLDGLNYANDKFNEHFKPNENEVL